MVHKWNVTREINGTISEETIINNRVPQRSVLGPLLFLLYMNDMQAVCDSNLFLYAGRCEKHTSQNSAFYFLYFIIFQLNCYTLKRKILKNFITLDKLGIILDVTDGVVLGWSRGWGWGWLCCAGPVAEGCCSTTLGAGPVETVACLRQPQKYIQ